MKNTEKEKEFIDTLKEFLFTENLDSDAMERMGMSGSILDRIKRYRERISAAVQYDMENTDGVDFYDNLVEYGFRNDCDIKMMVYSLCALYV